MDSPKRGSTNNSWIFSIRSVRPPLISPICVPPLPVWSIWPGSVINHDFDEVPAMFG